MADNDPLRLDKALRAEADFANQDYASFADQLDIDSEMFRRYRSPSELWDWRQLAAVLLGDVVGKDLLDFGCGMGEESIYFAKLGAKVTSIDISEVGIDTLKRRAAYHHVDVKALRMRADPTEFADASFDLVHGLGILHHVGIDAGLAEAFRVMRPGGMGVFLEPLGDSPTVEATKRWMMKNARFLGEFDHVTEYEENLKWKDIEAETARFARATCFPYHLLFRVKRFIPTAAWNLVRRIDFGLLALVPRLRHFAGAVVIRVHK